MENRTRLQTGRIPPKSFATSFAEWYDDRMSELSRESTGTPIWWQYGASDHRRRPTGSARNCRSSGCYPRWRVPSLVTSGKPIWAQAQLLYWQRQCLNYEQPPRHVAFEEAGDMSSATERAALARLSRQPGLPRFTVLRSMAYQCGSTISVRQTVPGYAVRPGFKSHTSRRFHLSVPSPSSQPRRKWPSDLDRPSRRMGP